MIDAHVHVWSLDAQRYPWQQTLAHVPIPTTAATAETLIEEMDRSGVSHAVLVQPSIYGWNNSYMCDAMIRWPSRFVGVCLVDPRSPDAGEKLRYWTTERGCRGTRVNLIAEPDAAWLLDPARLGLWEAARDLAVSVSLQIRPMHVPVVVRLAAAHPKVVFIIDYLGPEAFHDGSGIDAVTRLAALPNIRCKILALGQDSRQDYPFRDLWPLYERAVEAFGIRRLVYGTDFPHVYQRGSYELGIRWLEALPFIDNAGRAAIGTENATALWGIQK